MNIEIPENISTKEAFEFVEWVQKYYRNTKEGWHHRRQDLDTQGFITIAEIYCRWRFQKEAFAQAQKDYG